MSLNNFVKISAAGSGKTWGICNCALEYVNLHKKKVLITTYTNRGVNSIRNEICKQNKGVMSKYIIIKTWYDFLLSDLIKPYQNYLDKVCINEIKSFDFSNMYGSINFRKSGTKAHYLSPSGNVYANEASGLAFLLNNLSKGKVIHRLEKIYSQIYIDEIQDLAGYDLKLVELLLRSNINMFFCGDNRQSTYSTHNSKKNKKYSGSCIWNFFDLSNIKKLIKVEKNLVSRRFNKDICSFANSIYPNEDPITTCMNSLTGHDGVFIILEKNVELYYKYFHPCILRYDSKTNTKEYNSVNFGACKGETYDRVLIFPNGPFINFILKSIQLSSPEKYYVAATRPRYSLTFVLDKFPKEIPGFKLESIIIEGNLVKIFKYISEDDDQLSLF